MAVISLLAVSFIGPGSAEGEPEPSYVVGQHQLRTAAQDRRRLPDET
jgi:hypothetical protein